MRSVLEGVPRELRSENAHARSILYGTAKNFRGRDAVENTPSPAIRNGKPSPATVNTSRDKRRRFMQPPTQKRCQALHPSKPGIANFPRPDQKKQQNASRTYLPMQPKVEEAGESAPVLCSSVKVKSARNSASPIWAGEILVAVLSH